MAEVNHLLAGNNSPNSSEDGQARGAAAAVREEPQNDQ